MAPNGSNMTQNDPEWLTMPKDDIPEVKEAPGGQGGRQGAPGGARWDEATPDAKISDKTAIYWLQIMF